MRLSHAAYFGRKRNVTSGEATNAARTSRLECVVTLSSMISQRSLGNRAGTCSSKRMWLAPSRAAESTNAASPVAGSNAPCTQSTPRRP